MTITWIHLSDIQIKDKISKNKERQLNELINHIKSFRTKFKVQIDLIFITGDLVYSGKKSEYENLKVFLDKLIIVAGVVKNRLLIVPGNHDLDWGSHTLIKNFRDFEIDYFNEQKFSFSNYFTKLLRINGTSIALFGFNSCNKYYNEKIFSISKKQISDAIDDFTKYYKNLKEVDIKICLFHHPIDSLKGEIQDDVQKLLSTNFDFVLNGHGKSPIFTQFIDKSKSQFIRIISGYTFNSSMQENEYRYNIFSIENNTQIGKAYFFKYNLFDLKWSEDLSIGTNTGQIEFKTSHHEPKESYIFAVHAKDIGMFKELDVEFNKHFNYIIGPNGCGKTSILKCISLSFSLSAFDNSFRYGTLAELWTKFHYDNENYCIGTSLGWVVNGEVYRKPILKSPKRPVSPICIPLIPDDLEKRKIPFIPLVIGAYRRINYIEIIGTEKEKGRNEIRESYRNRAISRLEGVNEFLNKFHNVKQWMINRYFFKDEEWSKIGTSNWQWLIQNLPRIGPKDSNLMFIQIDKEMEPIFELFGEKCYLEEMSAGFQSILSLIIQIFNWIESVNEGEDRYAKNATGTVLVDELDVHLHPEWQFSIRNTLEILFPNLQFIVTTHSPHLITMAGPNEIISLPKFNRIIKEEPIPANFSGWKTDQILEDLLGVESLKNSEYWKLVDEALDYIEEKNIVELTDIIEKLKEISHPNDTIIEQLLIKKSSLELK